MKNEITLKELRSFIITIVFYLLAGSLSVYFQVPGRVFGIFLGIWTLVIFSFDFNLENIKRTFQNSLILVLGLISLYIIFMGDPYFFEIFSWYLSTLIVGILSWVIYTMGTIKKEELRRTFLETIEDRNYEHSNKK